MKLTILKRVLSYGSRFLQNNIIRTGVFILIGIGLLSGVSSIMVTRAADARIYQWYSGFYAEKEDSLDAVYIGSSATYAFWVAPLAWERYGIAVHPLTAPSQPFEAAEYLIKEARKTQSDALYIVPINTIKKITDTRVHYLVDNMPLSWNKVQLVRTMGKYMEIDWTEQLEYLFPLIRYHSRWTELTEADFSQPFDGFKGGSHHASFLRTSTDISSSVRTTERTGALPQITLEALDSLLEYCDTEQLNVLFIATPQADTDEFDLARMHTVQKIVQEHGYPVLDMLPLANEIGIDFTKDYYNAHHTNIHGATKVTDYLCRYLVENFKFEDKRGDPAYSSWDKAYENYTSKYASAYTLDVEWGGEPRDNTLAAPKPKVTVKGKTLTVSWNAVPEADGYRIYRKAALGSSWGIVDTVDADVLSYADSGRKAGTTYYYTVIAYREENGVYYWGDYDFAGVTGKALLNAPKLLSLEGSENDLTLTWNTVKGADGYAVFRKLPSKSWIQIADVKEATTFTDIDMLSDMPYQYTVKAYYLDGSGSRVMSSYDTTGLLYAPELTIPTLEAAVEKNGEIRLSWERIEGIQGYTVYRRTQNRDWEQLTTGNLSSDSTQFYDITAQEGIRYAYKLEAYIRVGDQERVYELETGPEWIMTEKAKYDTAMPEIVYLKQTWNQVYLAWESVASASSYTVYRRAITEEGIWSEWEPLESSVTGERYLDTPPWPGQYQYLVQSLFMQDGLTYYGEFDAAAGYNIIYSAAGK